MAVIVLGGGLMGVAWANLLAWRGCHFSHLPTTRRSPDYWSQAKTLPGRCGELHANGHLRVAMVGLHPVSKHLFGKSISIPYAGCRDATWTSEPLFDGVTGTHWKRF